jgi:hypothetical protein
MNDTIKKARHDAASQLANELMSTMRYIRNGDDRHEPLDQWQIHQYRIADAITKLAFEFGLYK